MLLYGLFGMGVVVATWMDLVAIAEIYSYLLAIVKIQVATAVRVWMANTATFHWVGISWDVGVEKRDSYFPMVF
jgi:hypothetical protein